MKIAQKSIMRMKNILKQDKESLSLPLLNMIKSDVYGVFSNYININPEDIEIKYFVDSDGFYDFELKMKASRIKKVNFF